MLEAIDGFVLVLNLCDNGRILYASEGITSLLGHIPNNLVDQTMSIFDMTSEDDVGALRGILSEKNAEKFLAAAELNEAKRIELFVHMDKGGAQKELSLGKSQHVLVRLSGYYSKWSLSNKSHHHQHHNEGSKTPCDEHCLPRKSNLIKF